jgi:hypothetical protein
MHWMPLNAVGSKDAKLHSPYQIFGYATAYQNVNDITYGLFKGELVIRTILVLHDVLYSFISMLYVRKQLF